MKAEQSMKSMDAPLQVNMGSPGRYRIIVLGTLGAGREDCMGGLRCKVTFSSFGREQTLLEGRLLDQAELSGVLNSLYDLRLPLLSVELLELDPTEGRKGTSRVSRAGE